MFRPAIGFFLDLAFLFLRWSVIPLICFFSPLNSSLFPSLDELTIEEKVGQLLLVHFHGEINNVDSERLIQEAHVGGFIYYQWANGLHSPGQISALSAGLQSAALQKAKGIPLFIAVDQEGGVVNRLKKGFTVFPGNYALGQTHQPDWAEECAYAVGQELRTVGVNMNLAPVVDVNSNPFNPIIGIRAFSFDPEQVALFGARALAGYTRAGIIATLKHFPGHGDVKIDSHESLPILNKSRHDLQQTEWPPFYLLSHQAPAILTAHLLIPALDQEHCATFSSAIIDGLLRKEWGYRGVVLTDSLVMQGLLDQCPSIEEAALNSLQAGHDIILLGGKQLLSHQQGLELTTEDILKIHRFLVNAVQQGVLAEERLDQSVQRILALKQAYRLLDPQPDGTCLDQLVEQHNQLAEKIACTAINVVSSQFPLPLNLQDRSIVVIAPAVLREELEQTQWTAMEGQAKLLYFDDLNPSSEQVQALTKIAGQADFCFFFSYNCWKHAQQVKLFEHICKKCPQAVAIAVRNPTDAVLLQSAAVLVCTFGTTAYSLEAAKNVLMNGM
ncbi:glycoside hydrolase family 3 protein [Candidatus Protochlamydia phocaeensis]|uniref:glycoside hydrolase family 3 protein n=1 Tax=Candidatus Protochlamydia phocaeensis TaxID=1414722 RepID=UPI000B058E80|nr:glycoside hydrolase family 3 protein [Candidatus Protochlamydia phocaeensis]